MSDDNIAINKTLLVISPTKEEVKTGQDMLLSIATELECKVESSNDKY